MDVTIIVPVYNVEKYLPECLDSAINQTYKDLQIILVDDGSTDSSGNICDEYAKLDPRITVIHKPNGGQSDARNVGLTAATGKYIYFLDSDDYIEKNTIETLTEVAEENQLDILGFDGRVFYEDDCQHLSKKSYSHISYISRYVTPHAVSGCEMFLNKIKTHDLNRSCTPMHFYRRGFLTANNLTFKEGIIHEDELFTFISLLMAERAMSIPAVLYNRRIRSSSTMTNAQSQRNSDGLYTVLHESLEKYGYLHDNPAIRKAYEVGIRVFSEYYFGIYMDTAKLQDTKGREQFASIMQRLKTIDYINYNRFAYLKFRKMMAKIKGLKKAYKFMKRLLKTNRR